MLAIAIIEDQGPIRESYATCPSAQPDCRLGIAIETMNSHIRNIYRKLAMPSKAELLGRRQRNK